MNQYNKERDCYFPGYDFPGDLPQEKNPYWKARHHWTLTFIYYRGLSGGGIVAITTKDHLNDGEPVMHPFEKGIEQIKSHLERVTNGLVSSDQVEAYEISDGETVELGLSINDAAIVGSYTHTH